MPDRAGIWAGLPAESNIGGKNNSSAMRSNWPAIRRWCWICPVSPAATGRCWPSTPSRVILAAADSPALLDARLQRHPLPLRERIRVLQASAFAVSLPDGAVDCVFCLRPLDGNSRRTAFLRELHRVTRDTVILAIRAENFGSFQRDFTAAGFRLLGRSDFLPLFSSGQIAVLRKIELTQNR